MAEVDQEPITQVLGDVAPEALDDPSCGLLVGADDVAQLLRIQPSRQCRRAYQVAEHHRQLAAFAFGSCRGDGGGDGRRLEHFGCGGHRSRLAPIELADGLQEHLAMPQRLHAQLPQILIGQRREEIRCDVIVLEGVGILREPELGEPRSDVVHETTSTCRAWREGGLVRGKDSERRPMLPRSPLTGRVRVARTALGCSAGKGWRLTRRSAPNCNPRKWRQQTGVRIPCGATACLCPKVCPTRGSLESILDRPKILVSAVQSRPCPPFLRIV